MATIILQVSEESLVAKVKQACKMLVGVDSVKVEKQPKPYLYDSETGKYIKSKAVKEIKDALDGKGVTSYSSLKDFYKEMGL